MKKNNLLNRIGLHLAAALLLSGLTGSARGGGIDLKGVPDQASWVMQMESRELAALPAFQRLFARTRSGSGGALASLLALMKQASVNPTSDIQRVTAMGIGPNDQVVMVEGAWQVANLAAIIAQQAGYRKLSARGFDLLSMASPRPQQPFYIHFAGPRTILIGTASGAVASVAEALAKPGVGVDAFRTFSSMNAGGPGTLGVLLARDGAALMRLIPDATMLQQTTSIALQARALPRDRLGVELTALAADEQNATNLAQMLTGLQALMTMRATSDPLWGTLSQAMRIRAEGKQIRLDFALDAEMTYSLLSTVYRALLRNGSL